MFRISKLLIILVVIVRMVMIQVLVAVVKVVAVAEVAVMVAVVVAVDVFSVRYVQSTVMMHRFVITETLTWARIARVDLLKPVGLLLLLLLNGLAQLRVFLSNNNSLTGSVRPGQGPIHGLFHPGQLSQLPISGLLLLLNKDQLTLGILPTGVGHTVLGMLLTAILLVQSDPMHCLVPRVVLPAL